MWKRRRGRPPRQSARNRTDGWSAAASGGVVTLLHKKAVELTLIHKKAVELTLTHKKAVELIRFIVSIERE